MSTASERRDEVEELAGRLHNRKWTDRPPATVVAAMLKVTTKP